MYKMSDTDKVKLMSEMIAKNQATTIGEYLESINEIEAEVNAIEGNIIKSYEPIKKSSKLNDFLPPKKKIKYRDDVKRKSLKEIKAGK